MPVEIINEDNELNDVYLQNSILQKICDIDEDFKDFLIKLPCKKKYTEILDYIYEQQPPLNDDEFILRNKIITLMKDLMVIKYPSLNNLNTYSARYNYNNYNLRENDYAANETLYEFYLISLYDKKSLSEKIKHRIAEFRRDLGVNSYGLMFGFGSGYYRGVDDPAVSDSAMNDIIYLLSPFKNIFKLINKSIHSLKENAAHSLVRMTHKHSIINTRLFFFWHLALLMMIPVIAIVSVVNFFIKSLASIISSTIVIYNKIDFQFQSSRDERRTITAFLMENILKPFMLVARTALFLIGTSYINFILFVPLAIFNIANAIVINAIDCRDIYKKARVDYVDKINNLKEEENIFEDKSLIAELKTLVNNKDNVLLKDACDEVLTKFNCALMENKLLQAYKAINTFQSKLQTMSPSERARFKSNPFIKVMVSSIYDDGSLALAGKGMNAVNSKLSTEQKEFMKRFINLFNTFKNNDAPLQTENQLPEHVSLSTREDGIFFLRQLRKPQNEHYFKMVDTKEPNSSPSAFGFITAASKVTTPEIKLLTNSVTSTTSDSIYKNENFMKKMKRRIFG